MIKSMFIFAILLLTSVSLVKSDECSESLKCLDPPTNDSNICSYQEEDVIYYRTCPPGYECKRKKEEESNTMRKVYTCQLRTRYKEDGSSCVLSEECVTNNCKDNKCTAKAIGAQCTEHLNCEKNAFCNQGFCKLCAKEGEKCDSYKECLAGYSCEQKDPNATHQICIADFSIPSGEYASKGILCESARLDDDTHLCYDIESNVTEGTSCQDDTDCPGTKIVGKEKTKIAMTCGCTWDKKRICDYGSKSKGWTSYISYYKSEMKKKNVSRARVEVSLFDFTYTNDWNINNYSYKAMSNFYKAPSCLLDALNYPNKPNNTKGIKLSFIFLFGFILLL